MREIEIPKQALFPRFGGSSYTPSDRRLRVLYCLGLLDEKEVLLFSRLVHSRRSHVSAAPQCESTRL